MKISYYVSCIFKKGDKSEPGNYRPVSLTCVLCKIAESYIKDNLYNFLEEKGAFSDCQHGFRKGRSCVTQLIQVVDTLADRFEKGEDTDIIYWDFQKAFDKVPHRRLLAKLAALGVSDTIYNFIEDFLSKRKQRVNVEGSFSHWTEVNSGIPQGSILGPLLFTVFINDLPEGMQNICKMFADDTKIYGTPGACLQADLLRATEWAEKWQMNFNPSKCTVLHMGKKNQRVPYYMKRADGEEIQVTEVENERDVGVTFDTDLKFHTLKRQI